MSRPSDTHSHEQTRPPSDRDIAYVGYRQSGRAIVEKRPGHERLTPERSLALVKHSPSGFEWGYGGGGPAQLALALLLDYTGAEAFALDHYQAFKNKVVSQLDCAGSDEYWRLTASEIDAALRETTDEPVAPTI
ncbi:hypothetical protein C5B91_18935 [Haloferax sp. Atlit-10N]|jgi:hypothetical protein|uniref:Uncharacterized protein n=1 Tax=Halonotius terrestris TaxID=2487750 RepID=A0A8J8P9J9_9EURY|nr:MULTISPECIES: DUF6166 domain-containing protein [Haloferacales]RDZ56170.1 hypothetical protein C5B91_18935 [Haloferax sp. Atlit-10N]TQQ78543.1 hypothetical protein EGH24_14020 [Halonotius terrestris]